MRESTAIITSLALSISMPWLTGSAQLFPDQISGLLILGLVLLLGKEFRGARTTGRAIVFHVGLAALPWIHLKQLAPLVVLLGLWTFGVLRQRLQARQRLRALLPALIPFTAVVLLLLYNRHAFHDWRGPYWPNAMTTDFKQWFMILLALHFDRMQGLFVQNPFLLLGLVGLPIMARQRPLFTCGLGLLYFSLLLPNAMHTNWYGGYTFAGRFFWSSATLWCFPVMTLAERISQRYPRTWVGLAFASLACQAIYARVWFDAPLHLYSWGFFRTEHGDVLLPVFRKVLPAYNDFEQYLRTWSTWGPLALTSVLLGFGLRLSRKNGARLGISE